MSQTHLNMYRMCTKANRMLCFGSKKYFYQQEYWLLFYTTVKDSFVLDIGDITDISEIVGIKQLLSSQIEILLPSEEG